VTSRSRSLDDVLAEVDTGASAAPRRIVVSSEWWDALSQKERQAYQARCDDRGLKLSADHRISRHFVEVSDDDVPPLSSEHRV
jgi:hypothetical protein